MKPYDGGAWVGVTAIKDREALLEAYDDSGTRVMHLQKGVMPYEGFVRCVGLGPQWRCVNYDPDAPLHDRYRMDTDFLSDEMNSAAYRHDHGHQRVLRLGLQFLRVAAQRRRLASDRFCQRLPGLAGDVAALPLSLADQGQSALVDVLRRHGAPHEHRPELARLFRHRRQDMPFEEKLQAYVRIARERFDVDAFRGVLRAASGASRRGGARVFRLARPCATRSGRKSKRCIPAHEVEEFTELFWDRIQAWRAAAGRCRTAGMKEIIRWYSPRLEQDVQLVRWGHFRYAGAAVSDRRRRCRGGRALSPDWRAAAADRCRPDQGVLHRQHRRQGVDFRRALGRVLLGLQNAFDAFIYHEVTPAIRRDCDSEDIEIIAAGASIGAFNAVATVCRHPDAFKLAIAMSGTYDLSKYLEGRFNQDFYFSSPLHYLPRSGRPAARDAAQAAGPAAKRRRRLRGHRRVLAHGPACWAPKAYRTGSTPGGRTSATTGTPGGRCCPSTWTNLPE